MTGRGMHGFGKTLAGSLVLHAALLVAVALAYTGSSRVFITPVYTVDLVAGPAVKRAQQGVPATEPQAAPEPVKEPEAARAEPARPAVEEKSPAREPAQETVKITERPSVAEALKKIEKRLEQRKDASLVASSIDELKRKKAGVARLREEISGRTTAATAPETKISPQRAAPSASGGAPRVSLEERYSAYYSLLRDRVQEGWVYPQGLKDNRISVIVSMKIARDGRLLDLSVEKSSGNRAFDDSLLKAIRRAEPFPPLPADLEGGSLETGLRFCPGCQQ